MQIKAGKMKIHKMVFLHYSTGGLFDFMEVALGSNSWCPAEEKCFSIQVTLVEVPAWGQDQHQTQLGHWSISVIWVVIGSASTFGADDAGRPQKVVLESSRHRNPAFSSLWYAVVCSNTYGWVRCERLNHSVAFNSNISLAYESSDNLES